MSSKPHFDSAASIPHHIARQMREEDRRALHIELPEETKQRVEVKEERDLQNLCESWLRGNGYWPRTPAFLSGGQPERGYYIHLHEAKRNPILLDLLILGNDGRYLEVELKTSTGKLNILQQVICGHGAPVCRSLEALKETMIERGMI